MNPDIIACYESTGFGPGEYPSSDNREREINEYIVELYYGDWAKYRPTFFARIMAGVHSAEYEMAGYSVAEKLYEFFN